MRINMSAGVGTDGLKKCRLRRFAKSDDGRGVC